MIVEMAGRPAEHLTTAIEEHIGILNKVDDIVVHSIKVSEPREVELPKDAPAGDAMFTTFAEADFETETFARLAETMFDFMPSSVEVIEPAKVSLDMGEATALLNNISGRMHRYDDIMKMASGKIHQYEAQLQAAQKILIERDEEIVKLKKKKVVKKKAPAKKKKVVKKKKVKK